MAVSNLGTKEFLRDAGWSGAEATPFSADFSSRKYFLLRRVDGSPDCAVLMVADASQKTKEFVIVDDALVGLDISAPVIYAAEPDRGLVLMEYLGDKNCGKLVDNGTDPVSLYRAGMDVLVHLHKEFDVKSRAVLSQETIEALPVFNAELFSKQVMLFLDGYFPYATGREANPEDRDSFGDVWMRVLQCVENMPQTLLLRDYMLDNLMLLPERKGWRRAGVLDFQDAGIGPLPYDIASLCECVRRDQRQGLLEEIAVYYLRENPVMALDDLLRCCRILSAQRHARILGNVAQRPEKREFLPRILEYISHLFKDESLSPVRDWFQERDLL